MTNTIKKRHEIPIEMTWDTSLLFQTQADFNDAVKQFEMDVNAFIATYDNQLNDENTIIAALKQYELLLSQRDKLTNYVFLNLDVDRLNQTLASQASDFENIEDELLAKLSFVKTQLLQKEDAVLVAASQIEPRFNAFLSDIMKDKKHMLSYEKEQLLAQIDPMMHHSYTQYNTIKFEDMTFKSFEVNGQTYANSYVLYENDYEISHNTQIRRESAKSFYDTLRQYKNANSAVYLAHVKNERMLAKLRGFDSTIDYLLNDQDVTRDLMDRQIDVIMSDLAPIMRRYVKAVGKAHRLDKITHADLKISMPSAYNQRITPEESKALLLDALSVLGKDYAKIIERTFDERWVDFAQNEGKSTGGYCATIHNGPSYILLSWTGLMNEVLVLAHEIGHAGHFQLASCQSILKYEPSLYFIEAPSTANEVLACNALLKQNADKDFQIYLISEFISRTYFHNMVTHLLEAAFQREVYTRIDNGEFLNGDILCDIKLNIVKQFWGDDFEIGDDAGLIWMRQPHYYFGLYPYTYSAGLTIGTAMAQKLENDTSIVNKWLETLALGASLSPLELAANAGVDVSTDKPLKDTIKYVDTLVSTLESLMA